MQGLIVGGGGGGGTDMGGGGGAGGYVDFETLTVTSQALTITVGAGGAGAAASSSDAGVSGGNSVVSGNGILLTSLGGAGGASLTFSNSSPARTGGGSGGGASGGDFGYADLNSLESQTTQSQVPSLISIGGNQFGNHGSPKIVNSWTSGGGGGAGSPGNANPGDGGAGYPNAILGTSYFWAGGGGGSGHDGAAGNGGNGGGGAGGRIFRSGTATGGTGLNPVNASPDGNDGGNGGVNTGGGGGGSAWTGFGNGPTKGGNGGSGIVVLKYLAPSLSAAAILDLSRAPVGTERRVAFSTQPQLTIRDSANNTDVTSSATVNVSVSAGGRLLGTTSATASSGIATFTNLGIDGTIGETYDVIFTSVGFESVTTSVTLTPTTCNGEVFACQIGDTGPGGGTVFYIAPSTFTQNGATGSMCTTNCNYLEAAPRNWVDGADPKIIWSRFESVTAGAQQTSIGSGYSNTLAIIAAGNTETSTSAAKIANDYSGGGKTDWYLPSKDELNQMCKWVRGQAWVSNETTCDTSGSINTGLGAQGFGGDWNRYWSSTEGSSITAWWQDFVSAVQLTWDYKATDITRVRPVRAFYSNFAPTTIQITRASVGSQRGVAFTTQPQITIKTALGITATDSPAIVTASISAGGTLVGSTTAIASSGVATFNDLGVDGTVGNTYVITYTSGRITVATESVTVTGDICDGSVAICQIGDRGPGGGNIFYYSAGGFNCGPTHTNTCNYLEVAPNSWNGGSEDPKVAMLAVRNDSLPIPSVDQDTSFVKSNASRGLGYKNSLAFKNFINSSDAVGAGLVTAYRGGSKSDWYIPSSTELNLLCQWARGETTSVSGDCSNTTLINGGFISWPYWSSSQFTDGNGNFSGFIQYFDNGSTTTDQWGDENIALRPIRAFAPVIPVAISVAAINGVVPPVTGATPVSAVTAGNGYTGSVSWSGSPSTFAGATVYTATITLTATSGYTLNGVTANFFTVESATSVSNSANSGVITVIFPATTAAPSNQSQSPEQDNPSKAKPAQELLISKIMKKAEITYSEFNAAEVSLKSSNSLSQINQELKKLQEMQPGIALNLEQIRQTIRKISLIESLVNPRTKLKITVGDFVSAGFIDSKNPNRVSIALTVRKLPSGQLETIEAVNAAISKQIQLIQLRKDRLQKLRLGR